MKVFKQFLLSLFFFGSLIAMDGYEVIPGGPPTLTIDESYIYHSDDIFALEETPSTNDWTDTEQPCLPDAIQIHIPYAQQQSESLLQSKMIDQINADAQSRQIEQEKIEHVIHDNPLINQAHTHTVTDLLQILDPALTPEETYQQFRDLERIPINDISDLARHTGESNQIYLERSLHEYKMTQLEDKTSALVADLLSVAFDKQGTFQGLDEHGRQRCIRLVYNYLIDISRNGKNDVCAALEQAKSQGVRGADQVLAYAYSRVTFGGMMRSLGDWVKGDRFSPQSDLQRYSVRIRSNLHNKSWDTRVQALKEKAANSVQSQKATARTLPAAQVLSQKTVADYVAAHKDNPYAFDAKGMPRGTEYDASLAIDAPGFLSEHEELHKDYIGFVLLGSRNRELKKLCKQAIDYQMAILQDPHYAPYYQSAIAAIKKGCKNSALRHFLESLDFRYKGLQLKEEHGKVLKDVAFCLDKLSCTQQEKERLVLSNQLLMLNHLWHKTKEGSDFHHEQIQSMIPMQQLYAYGSQSRDKSIGAQAQSKDSEIVTAFALDEQPANDLNATIKENPVERALQVLGTEQCRNKEQGSAENSLKEQIQRNQEPFSISDSDELIQRKLAERHAEALTTFYRYARDLTSREEIESLYNRLMGVIDEEYARAYPSLYEQIKRHVREGRQRPLEEIHRERAEKLYNNPAKYSPQEKIAIEAETKAALISDLYNVPKDIQLYLAAKLGGKAAQSLYSRLKMKPGLATSSRVHQSSSSSAAQSGLLKKASQVHQMEKSAAEGAARLSDEASVALSECGMIKSIERIRGSDIDIQRVDLDKLKTEIESARKLFQTAEKIKFEDLLRYNLSLAQHGFQPISKKAYKHILMSHYQDGAKYIHNQLLGFGKKSVFNSSENFLELAIKALDEGQYISSNQVVYDCGRIVGIGQTGQSATKILINIAIEGNGKIIQTIYPI